MSMRRGACFLAVPSIPASRTPNRNRAQGKRLVGQDCAAFRLAALKRDARHVRQFNAISARRRHGRNVITMAVTSSAAADASTSADYSREHVLMVTVVVPERELREVERQVSRGDVVVGPHHAALEQGPEATDIRGVDLPRDVLARTVVDGIVGQVDVPVSVGLVRGDEGNPLGDGLADKPRDVLLGDGLDNLGDDLALACNGSQ